MLRLFRLNVKCMKLIIIASAGDMTAFTKKVSGPLSGPIVALATFITDASCHATHVSPFPLVRHA